MRKNLHLIKGSPKIMVLQKGGLRKFIACMRGSTQFWGGVREKKKYVRGVGEKIKICEGGVREIFRFAPLRISNGIALTGGVREGTGWGCLMFENRLH